MDEKEAKKHERDVKKHERDAEAEAKAHDAKAKAFADAILDYANTFAGADPEARRAVMNHLRDRERSAAFLLVMEWLDPEYTRQYLTIGDANPR